MIGKNCWYWSSTLVFLFNGNSYFSFWPIVWVQVIMHLKGHAFHKCSYTHTKYWLLLISQTVLYKKTCFKASTATDRSTPFTRKAIGATKVTPKVTMWCGHPNSSWQTVFLAWWIWQKCQTISLWRFSKRVSKFPSMVKLTILQLRI